MTQEELDKLMAGDIEDACCEDDVSNLKKTLDDIHTKKDNHTDEHLITQLDNVTKESEKKASEVFDNLDLILEKLDGLEGFLDDKANSVTVISDIRNLIFETMSIMQYQDIHRQKIERVINTMSAISVLMNDTLDSVRTFTPSAKHIAGDKNTEDVVGNDDIDALIASFN